MGGHRISHVGKRVDLVCNGLDQPPCDQGIILIYKLSMVAPSLLASGMPKQVLTTVPVPGSDAPHLQGRTCIRGAVESPGQPQVQDAGAGDVVSAWRFGQGDRPYAGQAWLHTRCWGSILSSRERGTQIRAVRGGLATPPLFSRCSCSSWLPRKPRLQNRLAVLAFQMSVMDTAKQEDTHPWALHGMVRRKVGFVAVGTLRPGCLCSHPAL